MNPFQLVVYSNKRATLAAVFRGDADDGPTVMSYTSRTN